MPRVDGSHCGAWVIPRFARAITVPVSASIADSYPPQSPTYSVLRKTDGADAIGPLTAVLHASVSCGAVTTLMLDPPVGVPLIDNVPQYFGQPVVARNAGLRGGRDGLNLGPGAAAVRTRIASTLPKTRFIHIYDCRAPETLRP